MKCRWCRKERPDSDFRSRSGARRCVCKSCRDQVADRRRINADRITQPKETSHARS